MLPSATELPIYRKNLRVVQGSIPEPIRETLCRSIGRRYSVACARGVQGLKNLVNRSTAIK